MKELSTYIEESLIRPGYKGYTYKYTPNCKDDLLTLINIIPIDEWSLIDTSNITDMSKLFFWRDEEFGDISGWDVSNVINMRYMFTNSIFNDDISEWDVSNVINMSYMFNDSHFNNDISGWEIQPKCRTYRMFDDCPIRDEYKPKGVV